jgi:sec-independent protein translocase protein TatC
MNSGELSVLQHLAELRRRVLYSVLALLVGSAVAFPFYSQIIKLLILPAGDLDVAAGELVFVEVTESFTTSVKVSMVGGFVLALPVILYHVVMFVAPGLTGRERLYLLGFLPAVFAAFAGGVAFGYFVLTPNALHFLLNFGADVAAPTIRISNIVNFMVRLLFWMGIAFETPLVMYLLAQLGVVNARMLSRFRRFWVVVAFLLSAIITPTVDPVNQALVAAPLLVLYELGVLLARLADRSRRASTAITPS